MIGQLSAVFDRFQIYCVARLMLSIAKRQSDQKVTPDEAFHSLLPVWNQLFASKCVLYDHELRILTRSLLLSQLPREAWSLIPSLEKREAPVKNTWTYQNEDMQWDIAQNDLVLDIGSGGWPFKRANHLADRYPKQTTHRMDNLVRDKRPFSVIDLEHLPFIDHAYDFIFCSHVLEHLDNPGQAIRELMRVGRRGYIEVPTRLSDVMFNFTRLPNHHRWHGMILGETVVLVEWNDWERRDLGNCLFDALHSEYKNTFQDFFERNHDLFFASCRWSEEINFLIIDKQGVVIDASRYGCGFGNI